MLKPIQNIGLIRSRIITTRLKPPDEAVWLFEFNKDCQIYNKIVHSKLSTVGSSLVAWDINVNEFQVYINVNIFIIASSIFNSCSYMILTLI